MEKRTTEPPHHPEGEDGGSALDLGALDDLRSLQAENGPGAVAGIIGLYLQNSASLMARLRDAAASGDTPAMSWAAHSLRGSTGIFGARRMLDLLAQLEKLATSDYAVDSSSLLAEIVPEYAALCAELELMAAKDG